jgi:galactonate dehydratase
MRVVDYHVYHVKPRWIFTKLVTDDGLVGWGEHVAAGSRRAVTGAIETLVERHVLGEDPRPIQDRWETMYRGQFYRGGPVMMAALAGIDQALWDIKGKSLDVPVYELLGGRARDRMRVYTWIGGDRPSDVGEAAKARRAEGFTAVKMNATEEVRRADSPTAVEAAVDRIAAVRDAVGTDLDVALDFHGRVPKPMAGKLASAVEEFDPLFVEEPVLAENNEALGDVANHTTTPIATGERMYTRAEFKTVLETGAVDIVQPDLAHAGGITEATKIASMADAYDVAFAPHCPLGPIALAACLQVDAAAPNALIQEQSLGIHYHDDVDLFDYVSGDAFAYDDGHVEIPDGPGLGVDVSEDAFEPWPDEIEPASVWRHPDGSFAEW